MPSHATREFLRAPSRSAFWVSAALAITAHAAGLFVWNVAPLNSRVMEVGGGEGMEVALVESESAGEEESPPKVPEIAPPQPEPEPERVPEPPIPLPEPSTLETEKMPLPEAAPPVEATTSNPSLSQSSASTPTPRPPRASRPPGERRSGARGSGSSSGGAGAGAGKPAFLVRPSPVYPPESRAAGESGVVLLHITTNAGGRPTAVDLAKSSGFPRLDRAAIEAAWRCRISNASAGAVFEAPVRFRLQR